MINMKVNGLLIVDCCLLIADYECDAKKRSIELHNKLHTLHSTVINGSFPGSYIYTQIKSNILIHNNSPAGSHSRSPPRTAARSLSPAPPA